MIWYNIVYHSLVYQVRLYYSICPRGGPRHPRILVSRRARRSRPGTRNVKSVCLGVGSVC